AAMFVLSAGLVRTGIVQWLGRRLDGLAGRGETRLLLILCLFIALLSAFVVNTATVTICIPIAVALAKARKLSPSRVLMPLSFASQFGGVCTLIGTSTNLLMNSIALGAGLAPFGLFEFAPLGIVLVGIGTVYLLIVPRHLVPERKASVQRVDRYRLADYLAEFVVAPSSPLIGKTWAESEAFEDDAVELIDVLRGGEAKWRATATEIREGDLLLVHGHADRLIHYKDAFGLKTRADVQVSDERLSSADVKLFESLVPLRSHLVGRTLATSGFRRRFGCVVLAIQRRGRILRSRLAEIRLEDGDTLLLQGDADAVTHAMRSPDLVVIDELTEFHLRRDRALIAFGLLALVVGLAAFGIVPIVVAALLGSVGMVLGGCLSLEEAYRSIDWKVVFLLGGMLPLGHAMETSGAASWIADTILGPLAEAGPLAVLAAIYAVTATLTEVMSNNAAAVLLAPIALSLAAAMDASPRPFLVAITFAASTSFATPFGYQTNTLVYAPGGYRFSDYLRVGVPLNFLFWGAAILLIPRIWPF
ncbi:MAG: SLC13 family permease, partial [Planctomycetes bacterium]|nr:SLC13 family permease [Planctomycetota bacterium]